METLETKNNAGFVLLSSAFAELSSSIAEAQTKATDKNIQFILYSCFGDRSS